MYHLAYCVALCVALLALGGQVTAQPGGIRGRIMDSIGENIQDAEILMFGQDSTLKTSTRSRKDGRFAVEKLPAGQYQLLIKAFGYIACSRKVKLVAGNLADLGVITMIRKSDTLLPVTVTPRVAVLRLKGDTLEYSTAGIPLRANAPVDELLRRLPGVQVNPDGTILVNGKNVERLLIDGEDIFGVGTDLRTLTRNFNGDLFSQIQVLEKKSDRAVFTGIDDGKTTLTLNLVVKPERKNGYFGKLDGGLGSDGYYDNTGLLGAFGERKQFAVLGLASSIGTTGFAGASEGGDVPELTMNGPITDGLDASAGTGIPSTIGGGGHYSEKQVANGEHLRADYNFGQTMTTPYTNSTSEEFLPDTIFLQKQSNRSINRLDAHHASGLYEIKLDTLSSLRMALQGSTVSSDNQFAGTTSTALNNTPSNQEMRNISSRVLNQSLGGSVYWNKVLGQKGGTLSVTASAGTTDNSSSGYLFAADIFADSTTDTTDQRKIFSSRNILADGTVNYTRSLNRLIAVGAAYGFSSETNRTTYQTYNKGNGKYDETVDSLNSDVQLSLINQRATINLALRNERYLLIAAVDWFNQSLSENNQLLHQTAGYSYKFINPRISGHIKFDATHIFYFNYNGTQESPPISQLQRLQNNADPLQTITGNPNLKPTISHTISSRMLFTHPSPLNIGFVGILQENAIASRTSTDSLGKQVIQPVNVNGNKSLQCYVSYTQMITPTGPSLAIDVNGSYDRQNTFAGDILTINDVYRGDGRLALSKTVSDRYRIEAVSDVSYALVRSSVNTLTTSYWTQTHRLLADLQLPAGFVWNTSLALTFLQKTAVFPGNNRLLLWDTYINKNFLKGALSLKFSGKNLLQQNTSITRAIAGNQITESITNGVPGRYLLLSLAYHFLHKSH